MMTLKKTIRRDVYVEIKLPNVKFTPKGEQTKEMRKNGL